MITSQPQSFQEYETDSQRVVNAFEDANPTVIIQYIRKRPLAQKRNAGAKSRQRRGVVIAYKGKSGEIRAGYSLCNVGKEKRGFNSIIGLRKAIQNSCPIYEISYDTVPHGVQATLRSVIERAMKTFPRD